MGDKCEGSSACFDNGLESFWRFFSLWRLPSESLSLLLPLSLVRGLTPLAWQRCLAKHRLPPRDELLQSHRVHLCFYLTKWLHPQSGQRWPRLEAAHCRRHARIRSYFGNLLLGCFVLMCMTLVVILFFIQVLFVNVHPAKLE
jgi:hypothetical protein